MNFDGQSDNLQQLVLQRRWEDVEARVRAHPEELKMTNNNGLNVIHLACCRNPPSATIRVMLEQDIKSGQGAVLMTEWYGRNPLMYVCDGRGPIGLVKDFVELAPHCVSETEESGWTPIHFLCVNSREHSQVTLEMAELLLTVDRRQVYKRDVYGQTPLGLLCDQFEALLASELAQQENSMVDFDRIQVRPRTRPNPRSRRANSPRSVIGLVNEVEYFWSLSCLLIQAFFPHPTKTPMLHQFCTFPRCPDFLIGIAIRAFQSEIMQGDLNGNTPLHLAVLQGDADLVIRLLAGGASDALRIKNNQGQLPLTLAFSLRYSDVHSILLDRHAGALEASGFSDKHYPQLIAGKSVTPNSVYEVLRAKPDLICNSFYER
jgi:ankyrin repeat protein